MNYQFSDAGMVPRQHGIGANWPKEDIWNFHGQTTFTSQYASAVSIALCRTEQPRAGDQGRETWDATAYLGLRLWDGAEFWINPEIDQGFGLEQHAWRCRVHQWGGL